MRKLIGILVAAIVISAYLFIPQINEWLINIGVFQDKDSYREPVWLYFYMVIIMTIALVILFILGMLVFGSLVEWSWNLQVKKAKRMSKETYGVSFLYYTFLDQKYLENFYQEIKAYKYRVVQHYEEKYKLKGLTLADNSKQYVEDHYEKYREELRWPQITLDQNVKQSAN